MSRWWIKLLRHAHLPARSLVGIGALLAAGSVLDALKPWPIKLLVDHVLRAGSGRAAGALWLDLLPGAHSSHSTSILAAWLAGAGVLIYAMGQAARMLQGYIQAGLGGRIAYSLGAELLDRLQELSLVFHSRQRVGDLVRRVVTDSGCVRDLVCGVIIPAAAALANLVLMFAIMCRLDPMLSLVAIAFAAPLAMLIGMFSRPMAQRSYEQQQLEGQVLALAEQTLGAVPIVQAFSREADHDRRFRELAAQTSRAAIRTVGSQLQFKIGTGAVTAAGTAMVMIVGGMHVLDGRLTIGGLLVFLAYLASLYAPLETLAYLSMGYATAAAAARRVLEVLENRDRVVEKHGALALATSRRGLRIQFESVSFGYEESQPVLQEIDVEFAPGRVAALVGPTGAGKSTLASLVPRLFDPWSGRIRLDGHDLRDLKLVSLRQQVAVVPQEPLLLPMSVAGNIAYARPGAQMREIVAAAQAAGASEFIERLPQGYQTVIGERGATLSAGQRQRLSIARALLKDAPVLVMDEPTSALDPQTERSIVDALARLMQGRTCIIIAHRLSTIRRADVIVVLEDGRIAQRGAHRDLVEAGGTYQRMYELQTTDPSAAGAVS